MHNKKYQFHPRTHKKQNRFKSTRIEDHVVCMQNNTRKQREQRALAKEVLPQKTKSYRSKNEYTNNLP